MDRLKKTGTKEWAETNINIQLGCEHNCRYCYARYDAVKRFRRCSAEGWANPVIDQAKVDREYRKFSGRVMFPSTHDITPRNISECMVVLRRLLDAGNDVLIVTKPHWKCVTLMCEMFKRFRRQITFRFTIGSTQNDVLRFWEPGAPNYNERLGCLIYAFHTGYSTSVSCEPFLGPFPQYTYEAVVKYLTDSFWLGKMRNFNQRVDLAGATESQKLRYVELLKTASLDQCVIAYYRMLKDRPYVKFKDSVRKIVEKHKEK